MSSSVETLECYMDEMVECFEDFIKKSLVIMTLAIGALVGMLMYLLKTIHSTGRQHAVGAQTQIEHTLAPTITNFRSSSSSSNISTRREPSPCGKITCTSEECHLVGKDERGRIVEVDSKEDLKVKKSTSSISKKVENKCPARQNPKKSPARGTSFTKIKNSPGDCGSKTCLKKPASDSCCSRTSSFDSIIARESAPNVVCMKKICVKKVPFPRTGTESNSRLMIPSLPLCPSQIPKCKMNIKVPVCNIPKRHPAGQSQPCKKAINKRSCCSMCCDDDPR